MKREIICKDCIKDLKKLFPEQSPYPGEYVRFLNGKAKKNMFCDSCGKNISMNEKCVAFSIYSDSRPYFDWENNYISTIKE